MKLPEWNPWSWLVLAGLCEIAWAVGLKYSNGLTKPLVSAVTIVLMLASFYFLSLAMKRMPLGTAYAVWTGIGAAGTAVIGMLFFNEPRTALRLVFLLGLAFCILGLRYTA
jgi:quaternary ammonium compound-resistance protein SugE